jgi:hypothetical protein
VGAYALSGNLQQAWATLDHPSLTPDDPNVLLTYADLYAREQRARELQDACDRLVDLARRTYVSPLFLARVHLLAGRHDQAFSALSRMCDERAPGVICLKVDVAFDPLRADPRFEPLLRRVGFAR